MGVRGTLIRLPMEHPPVWDVPSACASPGLSASALAYAAASGGGGRGPKGPGLNLDSRTLNDSSSFSGPGWAVTLMDFGGGVVEATCVFSERRRRLKTPSELDRGEVRLKAGGALGEVVEGLDRDRALRSVRRSKQSMKRRVYALCPDRLLTLTKRGKFPDIDSAWAAWQRFERVCSRFWRGKWKYVVVPEQHSDGTYHLHVALKGFYDVGLMRRFWYRALGGTGREKGEQTPGSVNIAPVRVGSRTRLRIASYLRKYMGKDLGSCVRGRRAFACSRGLVPIRVARWREPVHLGADAVAVVTRRVRALVGIRDLTLEWFEWSEAGLEGFTVKTAGA